MSDAEQKPCPFCIVTTYGDVQLTRHISLRHNSTHPVDTDLATLMNDPKLKFESIDKPVDGDLREVIENILDDFGHDVVNNPQGSRRSLQSKPIKQLEQLFIAHLQAAVRKKMIDYAKNVYARYSSYDAEEFETFLQMEIAHQLNQGEK